MEPAPAIQEAQDKILAEFLANAAFDGWTETAFRAAVKAADVSRDMAGLAFPAGAMDVISFWSGKCDRAVIAGFDPAQIPRLRDRVAGAVRLRLELMTADREAMRRAAQLLALPPYAPLSLKLAWRTADAIWLAAGDESADFAWYTKRATLVAVYGATLLTWLNDDSPEFEATWAFLDRRIADVMRFEKVKAQAKGLVAKLPSVAAIAGRLRYGRGEGPA